MKEIDKLFQTTEIAEIKKLLKEIIKEIETKDKKEKNSLLEEIVKKAKETEKKLKEECKVSKGLFFFSEGIAPLALLVEEISNDANNQEDILQVLKFNLNNYFVEFQEVNENDWHIEIENLDHIISALDLECDYFKALEKHGVNLSIMMFHTRYRKANMQVLNYNELKNQNFAIHFFYCEPSKELNKEIGDRIIEVCLEQFGYLLKEVLVGASQKAPDGFLEIFEPIKEMPFVDEESKDLTALFAKTFAHYIIEKMELRVIQECGPEKIKHLDTRNEEFVQKMLIYFDGLFEDLLKEAEEWEDNALCPCGSGKTYQNCCKKKKVKYYKGEDENHYSKSIPIHPDLKPLLEKEKIRFKQIFGRMPGKDDYVTGGVLSRDLNRGYKLMKRKNVVDQALLYATDKTGIMLTEENKDFLPDNEIKEFVKYVKEYRRLMKSKIKGEKCNILQATEATNFILESVLDKELPHMIYVLNLCVNFYSKDKQKEDNFMIYDIKDFLVFCAYKASLQLTVLKELTDEEYYDAAMAQVRIIYEILISMRAYKKNPDLFQEKILSVMGVKLGTHQKLKSKNIIEEIESGKQYKYEIQKRQLAEKAGESFEKLYTTFYRELSEFIHLDTESATKIFQESELFCDIDECLIAGFIGMVFGLEIMMELIEFEGKNQKMSNDIQYFSNKLLKDFLEILPAMITIEDKEVYHILEDTLKGYKTNYKINYQRNQRSEVY